MKNLIHLVKRNILIFCCFFVWQGCSNKTIKSIERERATASLITKEYDDQNKATDSIKKVIQNHMLTSKKSNLKYKP